MSARLRPPPQCYRRRSLARIERSGRFHRRDIGCAGSLSPACSGPGAAAHAHRIGRGPGRRRRPLHLPSRPGQLLRLDGRTGQVSLCGRAAAGWACQAVPDERAALEAEIARLQDDNAALKKELLARGLPLPSGVKPTHRAARAPTRPSRELAASCRAMPSSTG